MTKLNALFVSLAHATDAAAPRDTRATLQAVPASDPAENVGFVQHAKAWIARDTLLASLNRSHSDHTTRFVRSAIDADGCVSETRVRIIAEAINTARPITAGNNARKSALICANIVLKAQAGYCLRLKTNEVIHAPWSEEQATALKQRDADKAAAAAQRAADKAVPEHAKPEAPTVNITGDDAAILAAVREMAETSGMTIEEVLNIARDAVSERMIKELRDEKQA